MKYEEIRNPDILFKKIQEEITGDYIKTTGPIPKKKEILRTEEEENEERKEDKKTKIVLV